MLRSSCANPRIDEHVEEIDHQEGQDVKQRGVDDEALQGGEVGPLDRLQGVLAEAGQAKIDSSSTAPAKMCPATPPISVTTGNNALRRL